MPHSVPAWLLAHRIEELLAAVDAHATEAN